jgi:hypothetical protein
MRFWPALLLLSACGAQGPAGQSGDPETPVADLSADNLAAGTAPQDIARIQARVDAAMGAILRDPKSAKYANVRSGAAGAVCGEVDLKQAGGKYGGSRPFVITPQGGAFVSASNPISFGNPDDPFPDLYIRWCATPDELKTLGPGLNAAALRGPAAPAELPTIPELDPAEINQADAPAAATEAAPPARPPAPAAQAPQGGSGESDSFFNSVARKGH